MCLVSIHFQSIEWYVCTMWIYVLFYLHQVIAKTNLPHPKRIVIFEGGKTQNWLFQVSGNRCVVVPSNRLVQQILLRQVLSYDKTVGGWACHRFQSTEGCMTRFYSSQAHEHWPISGVFVGKGGEYTLSHAVGDVLFGMVEVTCQLNPCYLMLQHDQAAEYS